MMVPVEVSARHVHLSPECIDVLFGNNYKLTYKRDLSQPKQFVCEERVKIIGSKGFFDSVAVLGPVRNQTQVEISLTDARKIGVKPFIRESGDLVGTSGCILEGPHGKIELDSGVIVAKRHIHMHTVDANRINVKNKQMCSVEISGEERSLIFKDVVIRVSDNFSLAMHIDTDEGNAVNWKTGVTGNITL